MKRVWTSEPTFWPDEFYNSNGKLAFSSKLSSLSGADKDDLNIKKRMFFKILLHDM